MKTKSPAKKPKYKLDPQGKFIIENYNLAKPFANFFPGISGPYGIPIWAFFVNRGQAISCFGTKDKDHAILEFFPANKAWQLTPLMGFRTFLKIYGEKKDILYEPFHNGPLNLGYDIDNSMSITSYDLALEEKNLTLGIATNVEYFTIPNDNFGALVRAITVTNTAKKVKKIQLIDGLPQIIPFGTNNFFLKKMSRTIEAWMKVENLENGVPFYKLAVDPTDRPEVIHINEGNFYLGFHYEKNKAKIITPIVDPQDVFGPITDFTYPYAFANAKNFSAPKNKPLNSKTPSGFIFGNLELKALEQKTFYSVIGYMLNEEILNSSIGRITDPGYLPRKKEENKKVIEELQENIRTESSNRNFDLYAKQTYLDNILRGGYPVTFSSSSGNNPTVFYLYSRKHGDLERDYNRFQLQPTYFSQGNGNYRDVNQNRRSDIWFNPEIKDENIITFFNLLQADGFNPLVVKGVYFTLKNASKVKEILNGLVNENEIEKIADFIIKPFTPGDLIIFIEKNRIKLNSSYDELLNLILSACDKNQDAETTGEGFWTDHWTYNLDLIESYLNIYPENLKEIIFEKRVFTFYDNFETVKPRWEKYLLYNGLPKQLHSICFDTAKKEMIKKRAVSTHTVRQKYGEGEIYKTALINKLLCLTVNKMASLDPFGAGIEMEADKPNWFDSLNGLPALFGSSLCETLELKRLILFIKKAVIEARVNNLLITDDIHRFLTKLNDTTKEYLESGSAEKDYVYWDKSHLLKEEYLVRTRFGFSGNELEKSADELILILDNFLKKLESGINAAFDKQKNIYRAYFINEVAEYENLKKPYIKPLKFIQKKLPLFLESQVHAMKISETVNEAKTLHEAIKKSPLYDKKLLMYKVTAPLSDMPEEIGRCRVFTPGWLENESVWLHMEYKYLLEILRSGLHEEFYKEFKNVLIPFQKPERYGRSILENSSFLVSSAFPDKNMHGNGFVARLSGSTAEFVQIWLTMNIGTNPFFLNGLKELNLKFRPILAGWLFDKKGIYSFNFLGKISVFYHNPSRKNTFGKNGVKIKKICFEDTGGNPVEITADTVPCALALQIRGRQITRIDAYLE